MSFKTLPVRLLPMPDGRSWVLLDELVYGAVAVPQGFVTDFASLPAFLRWWTDPWGRHGHAAMVHDELYWTQRTSRKVADAAFLSGMRSLRVRPTQRYVLWLGVRLFGWWAWMGNREARMAGFEKRLQGDEAALRAHVQALWAESLEGRC